MKKFILISLILFSLSIFFYPNQIISNNGGSPGGKSGSPTDQATCQNCHYSGLGSGATITYSHHAITAGNKAEAVWGLVLTIVLAILFTALQAFEYVSANFCISDGIYG